jgi:hypothetical protein
MTSPSMQKAFVEPFKIFLRCITAPVPMWPALSRICCALCTGRCWTIPHTAQIYHVTSKHSAALKKALKCRTFGSDEDIRQQQTREFFVEGIHSLVQQWDPYFSASGDNF